MVYFALYYLLKRHSPRYEYGSYAKHLVLDRQSEVIKASFASCSEVQLSSTEKNKETEPAKIYNFPSTPDQRRLHGIK